MKFKKKYRAGGKTEKPMVYAQETTQVPSQTTVDPAIDPTRTNPYAGMRTGNRQYQYALDQYQKENPGRTFASYANLFSESLPNITFVNEDFDAVKEFAAKQGKDPDRFPFGINTNVFSDPSLKRYSKIKKESGFEEYADLFNRVTGQTDSENRMTSDSLESLYNNPNELYNTFKNMKTKGRGPRDEWIGEKSGFDFDDNAFTKTNRKTGKKENVPGFTYTFSDKERNRGNPLFNDTRLTNLYQKMSTGRLIFDMNGNLVDYTRDGDISDFNTLSDTERKSLELYVKNKGLQTIVTQGKTGQDLGQFADPGINIPSVGLQNVNLQTGAGTITPTQGMTNLMPTFIDKDDQVGGDIKQIDLEESKRIMSGDVPSGTDDPPPPPPTPPSDDTDKEGDTDKESKAPEDKETEKKEEVTTGVTVDGKNYASAEEARAALKKIPQTQLSDEQYEYLFGKKGMKVPGYKEGGIKLKKKKRKSYGN